MTSSEVKALIVDQRPHCKLLPHLPNCSAHMWLHYIPSMYVHILVLSLKPLFQTYELISVLYLCDLGDL